MGKLLIVDDDLESLKLVGLMFQGRGHQIIAAQNGMQALSKASEESPDLIILDVMMPGIDGVEVCRRLRADPRTQDIPIIMFTAKSQVEDKVIGFEAGADEYLTKPIHPAELIMRVEALLTRTARLGARAKDALRAKMIGFLGCKGGVGTTTVATNVAVALAAGPAEGKSVMLAELRSSSTSMALQLGLEGHRGLAALLERKSGLKADAVIDQMERHSSGLRVLGGTYIPQAGHAGLDVKTGEVILKALGQATDYLLLDMGMGLNELNQMALRLLRYVFVVTEPHKVAIRMASALLTSLDSLDVGRQNVGVILVHKAPSATTITKVAVEEELRREVVGTLSPAPEQAFQAAEVGVPMVLVQPASLVAQQVRQLAEFVVSL